MNLDLRKYFTPDALVDILAALPNLQTPVMDLLFSDVRTVPRPIIGVKDLGLPPRNIPVVRRGSRSYAIGANYGGIDLIEPQPVNPSEFLSGADLNNLSMLNQSSIQLEISNIVDRLRRACRATAEALSIQALTGKISYPMQVEGGATESYEVDYGAIADVSPAVDKKFDAAGAKISFVVKAIAAVIQQLKQTCDANDVLIFAGYDVYAVLCDLAGAAQNANIASANAEGLSIGGGFTIRLLGSTVRDLSDNSIAPVVPVKTLLFVDRQAGHKMIYASLDSLDAGLQPLPFFATYDNSKDPPGVKVIGESKPLPVVNVNGIAKAQVLT